MATFTIADVSHQIHIEAWEIPIHPAGVYPLPVAASEPVMPIAGLAPAARAQQESRKVHFAINIKLLIGAKGLVQDDEGETTAVSVSVCQPANGRFRVTAVAD